MLNGNLASQLDKNPVALSGIGEARDEEQGILASQVLAADASLLQYFWLLLADVPRNQAFDRWNKGASTSQQAFARIHAAP